MKEFDKIIGYSDEKKELEQIADILKNKEVYDNLGIDAPNGLLLYGTPGVGKTLMAKCLIEASGRPAVICRKNKPNGEFVNEIKNSFDKAVEIAPSIILLDDMDKFANEDDRHRNAEEYVTVQSCIDDVKGKNVFVLATANEIHCLPHSLRRAGRFDRTIHVCTPTGKDALKIISHYIKGKAIAGDIDHEYISRLMTGCSCAKLESIINEAGMYAGFERADKINMTHFLRAYMRYNFGSDVYDDDDDDDWCAILSDSAKEISQVVYHEAGHAVVSEVLEPESVTFLTASNCGKDGKAGFTAHYNTGKLNSFDRRIAHVICSLAGAAAVEQKYGIVSIGSGNDYDQAFNALCNLIEDECICGFNFHGLDQVSSEDIHSRQEKAVVIEIERYYRKAKEILAKNAEFLDKLALALAEKKMLTAPEIQEIKNSCNIVSVAA